MENMREGYVLKGTAAPGDDELALINKLSRRVLSRDEVYVFSVVLCDNEVDRDFERFSVEALKSLAALYIGKTGIFDHSMKGRDQIARIFDCTLEQVEGQFTKRGEPYYRLKARAYMPNCEHNREIILEIDAGIKKEVSVGCSVGSVHCSVCGADVRNAPCEHRKGRFYRKDGKKLLCHHVLDDPTDAYEWSFVAVPAQPAAGVVKSFSSQEKEEPMDTETIVKSLTAGDISLNKAEAGALSAYIETLKSLAAAGEQQLTALRGEVVRLGGIAEPELGAAFFECTVKHLNPGDLNRLKAVLEKKADALLPPSRQLESEKPDPHAPANDNFRI